MERRAARGDVRAEAKLLERRIASGEFVATPLCRGCSSGSVRACDWRVGHEEGQCNLIAAPGRRYCHEHHEQVFGRPDGCSACESTRGVTFRHVVRIMAIVGHPPARLAVQDSGKRCEHDPGGPGAPNFPSSDVKGCGIMCLDRWSLALGSTPFDDEPLVVAALSAAKPVLDAHLRSTSYCGGKDGTDPWCRCHRCRPAWVFRATEEVARCLRASWSTTLTHLGDDARDVLERALPVEPHWVAALGRVAIPEDSTREQNLEWCLSDCAELLEQHGPGSGFSAMREAVRRGVVAWAMSLPTTRSVQRDE